MPVVKSTQMYVLNQ